MQQLKPKWTVPMSQSGRSYKSGRFFQKWTVLSYSRPFSSIHDRPLSYLQTVYFDQVYSFIYLGGQNFSVKSVQQSPGLWTFVRSNALLLTSAHWYIELRILNCHFCPIFIRYFPGFYAIYVIASSFIVPICQFLCSSTMDFLVMITTSYINPYP